MAWHGKMWEERVEGDGFRMRHAIYMYIYIPVLSAQIVPNFVLIKISHYVRLTTHFSESFANKFFTWLLTKITLKYEEKKKIVKASRDKKVFGCATFNILLKKSFIEANKNVQQKQMRNVESLSIRIKCASQVQAIWDMRPCKRMKI